MITRDVAGSDSFAAGDSHPYRAGVAAVPAGAERPHWSVMIPTFNSACFLGETLTSVLAQDPGPAHMQIEVIDDHSTRDDPKAVVDQVGRGRVGFFRQPRNVGHIANFQTCLERSRGNLVHLLHGDDCVRPGFYGRLGGAFEADPGIGAAFCRYIAVDEAGHWQAIAPLEQSASGVLSGWLEKIAAGQRLQASCMAVRREVYERLGGFDRRIHHYGEDWEMWVRIAAHYTVWYEVEPLALYRVRSASLSGRTLRTGENVRDLRRVIAINRSHLPADRADALSRAARASAASAALRRAHRMLSAGQLQGPLAQAWEALRCRPAPATAAQALLVAGAWLRTALRTAAGGSS